MGCGCATFRRRRIKGGKRRRENIAREEGRSGSVYGVCKGCLVSWRQRRNRSGAIGQRGIQEATEELREGGLQHLGKSPFSIVETGDNFYWRRCIRNYFACYRQAAQCPDSNQSDIISDKDSHTSYIPWPCILQHTPRVVLITGQSDAST